METFVVRPFYHRGRECIGIFFANALEQYQQICKKAGATWSRTYRCWYIPLTRADYEKLALACKGNVLIEKSALQHYLIQKKKMGEATHMPVTVPITTRKEVKTQQKKTGIRPTGKIAAVNSHILPKMRHHLILKAYSQSTMGTYLNEMKQLLILLSNIPADELTTEHIKRYLVYCFEKLNLSENTLHSRINALKFYYEQVLGKEKFFWEIPRPKKPLTLPRFFSQHDIVEIIKATGNLKHKVMLMLAYSAGLRISEVVAMRTCNMDTSRMSILIERAKGKKDRMVNLSPVLLVMLREYVKAYKPDMNGYLFAGQAYGEHYSTRSMQMVLAAAKQKAGILKPGSVHALRHSFATHLLDKGTDVTMIMKLLGHNDIRTTLRYLHVTNRDILQVISPLDDLRFE